MMKKYMTAGLTLAAFLCTLPLQGDNPNQTKYTTAISRNADKLPFKIEVGLESYALPSGLHSYVSAIYEGKWLLLTGRTNGLHGFGPGNDNFPADKQNSVVYVVDPVEKTVASRDLADLSGSGLTTAQLETLTVTSAQFYQKGDQLYVTGGYGVDTAGSTFNTKSILSAIDIPGLIHWVVDPDIGETAIEHIRQISDPFFQVTGGTMYPVTENLTLLIFGQNFDGPYVPESNGVYTEQVRRFRLIDDGVTLGFEAYPSSPVNPDPNYRRRDLNIVPAAFQEEGVVEPNFVAFSGVFTEAGGIWTVPVFIDNNGIPSMADPYDTDTFKQGMNNYICPTIELSDKHAKKNYVIFLGGISYGYFENNRFETDAEIPFINQITAIKFKSSGKCTQYLMNARYPIVIYEGMDPAKQLLFGAGAAFFPVDGLSTYKNGVIKIDDLPKHGKFLIGYVVGGIQSTLPNTNDRTDSGACPYIFPVYMERQ